MRLELKCTAPVRKGHTGPQRPSPQAAWVPEEVALQIMDVASELRTEEFLRAEGFGKNLWRRWGLYGTSGSDLNN